MIMQAAYMNPFIFSEREYDYAASFKVISDALEMVEAGASDRFVTVWKLGANSV